MHTHIGNQRGKQNKLEATIKQGFNKEDGPFVKALDIALQFFNVQRQAYHSGAFVGNHVHCSLRYHTNECTFCKSLLVTGTS